MTRRILGVIGLVVAILVLVVWLARATSQSIAGIQCNMSEGSGYHVHAHLTIVVRNRVTYPPAGVGIHPEHLCLYWLHTHDASGIIHIEAPHRIRPTLREFFAVWGEPLSAQRLWMYRTASGETIRAYVGRTLTHDPGSIPLHNHTAITLEIGPPFRTPLPPDFHGL